MNVSRRQISKALYDLLASSYSFRKTEPTARIWTNVDAMDQPYGGLIKPGEDASEPQAYNVTRWGVYYSWIMYLRRDATPATSGNDVQYLIDDMIDGVEKALQGPALGMPQTLGNLVQNAYISGRIDIDPGLLDQQCKIEVPIFVVTGI